MSLLFKHTKHKCTTNVCCFLFFLIAIYSCNISKHVPINKQLIKKVDVEFNKSPHQSLINEEELYEVIKTKPNRRLLSVYRFHLKLYNLSNSKRIEKKIIKKEEKAVNKNQKIIAKNEKRILTDSTVKKIPLKERKLTTGEKIQRAGEAPSLYSELMGERTKIQLQNYLFNKGFFSASVKDSLIPARKNQVKILYKIDLGALSTINNVSIESKDTIINNHLDIINQSNLIKSGSPFDTDVLKLQRNNVTHYLQNNGFYTFTKEFVYYKIDTAKLENKVDVKLGIQNYKKINNENKWYELQHQQYYLNQVEVKIKNSFINQPWECFDTLRSKSLKIYNCQPISYQKRLLRNAITFRKGELYKKNDAIDTYKKLISLGLFKSVSMNFDTVENNLLDAKIDLIPAKTQHFSVSVDGTNNDGLFGVEGSMNYSHKNLFHGGERFLLSMKGALEMQLLLTENDSSSSQNSFNTVEWGPEVHFYIPKYFLINNIKAFKKHTNAKTDITATINYQKRPDFTRWNQELSFGWVVHEKKSVTWHINPILISAIDIENSNAFQLQIDTLNDQFIAASFQDHIVAGSVFSFEYNNQNTKIRKNDFYAKATVESAGGLLHQIHELIGKDKNPLTNSYDLLGIRYAHYKKATVDLRYYQPVFYKSKMVYRFFGGMGIPQANLSEALPFEKSFFIGGANSMRAWRARSLGPGSFYDSIVRYDKIGDIQLEANIEARFPIYDWIEGALFVDMGNVWLSKNDPLRSNGQFKWNSFINDVAVGGGFGLRLNFDFFIVRADLAIPLRNPVISPNNESIKLQSPWIFDGPYEARKTFHPVQFNLGIGYPF